MKNLETREKDYPSLSKPNRKKMKQSRKRVTDEEEDTDQGRTLPKKMKWSATVITEDSDEEQVLRKLH